MQRSEMLHHAAVLEVDRLCTRSLGSVLKGTS